MALRRRRLRLRLRLEGRGVGPAITTLDKKAERPLGPAQFILAKGLGLGWEGEWLDQFTWPRLGVGLGLSLALALALALGFGLGLVLGFGSGSFSCWILFGNIYQDGHL